MRSEPISANDVRLEISIEAGIQDDPIVSVSEIARSIDARPGEVREVIRELEGSWEILDSVEIEGVHANSARDKADRLNADPTEDNEDRPSAAEAAEGDGETDHSEDEDAEPDWIRGDPNETVREAFETYSSGGSRDLQEVLAAAEQADSTLQLTQRLAFSTINSTRALLSDLGLAGPTGRLLDDDERSQRIETLREEYL